MPRANTKRKSRRQTVVAPIASIPATSEIIAATAAAGSVDPDAPLRVVAAGPIEFPAQSDLDTYFADDPTRLHTFKALAATPNAKFFALRLTFLNRRSAHAGVKFILDPAGANYASLVGKPVHFTSDLERHFEIAEDGIRTPRTFGVTLGGRVLPALEDGAVPLETFGLLWERDYPDAVAQVQSEREKMGASWEIEFSSKNAEIVDEDDPTLRVSNYDFSGIAILRRDKAAYPGTEVYIAQANGEAADCSALFADLKSKRHSQSQTPAPQAASASPLDPAAATSRTTGAAAVISKPTPPVVQVAKTYRRQVHASASVPLSASGKEFHMKFCASCEPQFQAALDEGEILYKAQVEAEEFVRAKNAEVTAANATAEEAVKKAARLEAELAERTEKEKFHDRKIAAQTKAIEEWEGTAKKPGDRIRFPLAARTSYLDAKAAIFLEESAEAVSKGWQSLFELTKKYVETNAGAAGNVAAAAADDPSREGRPEPLDAFRRGPIEMIGGVDLPPGTNSADRMAALADQFGVPAHLRKSTEQVNRYLRLNVPAESNRGTAERRGGIHNPDQIPGIGGYAGGGGS